MTSLIPQTRLANWNNPGPNDLVIYVVQALVGGSSNFVGYGTHPANQSGAAMVQVETTHAGCSLTR